MDLEQEKNRVDAAIANFSRTVDESSNGEEGGRSSSGSGSGSGSMQLHRSMKKKYEDYVARQEEDSLKDVSKRAVRPWNFADYQSRVYSFKKTSHWFAKPGEISVLQCALHGWTNTDVDTVSCAACATTCRVTGTLFGCLI
jgi:hypothetical protein